VKLLFLNYEFPPVGGGAAQASLATSKELAALGHRVDFLTISTEGSCADHDIDGVRVRPVRGYRRGLHDVSMTGALSFLSAAGRRLPQLAREQNYDLYHYYFGLPTGLLRFVPGPHRDRPYVVSLRGSDVPGYDQRLATYHRVMMPITRRIWHNAAHVVANSDGLRRLALASLPQQTIDVIRNGVDVPASPERPNRTQDPVRILIVSRLIDRKGINVLLQAFARLNGTEVSLDIAGDGPARQRLEDMARTCGVADRVRFHGFTARSALESLYRQSDIFVLTSLAESCSMALLEAMAAGLPVVATDVGGNPELVEHGANGLLVRPDDVDDLASAIGALLQDPARRRRFGATSRERAIHSHSWRSVAERYEALFEGATGISRPLDAGLDVGSVRPAAMPGRSAR
jgi:glycosyltransferase involved in cell wall biosynthesis